MEEIGHKLMAFRIDEQFLGILHSQLSSALEKLGLSYTFKLEGKAAVEILYYLLSLGLANNGLNSAAGTPGMQAVGLSSAWNVSPPHDHVWVQRWARAVLVVSFLSVKWSFIKLQELSTTHMWSMLPSNTLERRTQEFLKVGAIVAKCLSLLSFAVFLSNGDCPDLLYRMTGIGMAKTNSSSPLGAGYNSAMLFVEGKKMLWLALLGASAAATIAIDWRALKYYCYFYVRSVLSMVHSIRQRARSAILGTVTGSGRSSLGVFAYVQSLFGVHGTSAVSEQSTSVTSSGDGDTRAGMHARTPSAAYSPLTRGEGIERPAVCASCQSTSPEMPHRVDCGHIYCYICVHRLVHSAPGANQYDILHTGVQRGAVTCVTCYAVVTKFEPLAAS